jgi:hypothetical protein
MSLSAQKTTPQTGLEENGKVFFTAEESQTSGLRHQGAEELDGSIVGETTALERKLVRKIDLRLCTIAGILCRYVYLLHIGK